MSIPPLLVRQHFSVYTNEKKILTYQRYAYISSQSGFNLIANHTYTEIIIVFVIDTNFLESQYNIVIYPAK